LIPGSDRIRIKFTGLNKETEKPSPKVRGKEYDEESIHPPRKKARKSWTGFRMGNNLKGATGVTKINRVRRP